MVGVGIFLVSKKDSKSVINSGGTTQQTATKGGEQSVSQAQSVDVLRAGGKPQKCNFSYSGAGGNADAVMYTDGQGKSRIDMDTVSEKNNSGKMTQIIKDGKSYSIIQSGDQKLGFVYDLEKLKQQTGSTTDTANSVNQGVPTSSNFDMKCQNWSVDSSLFEVPSDVRLMSV